MLSVRPWIAIALLAVSWLFATNYFELPSGWCEALMLLLAAGLLATSDRARVPVFAAQGADEPSKAGTPAARFGPRKPYPELAAATVMLLVPVIWWSTGPFRVAAAVIVAGLLLEYIPRSPRWISALARAAVFGGMILLLQGVAFHLYATLTARSHDAPAPLVNLLAALMRLAGVDAAGDGPLLAMQSMRQPIRLAVTWDWIFDPASMMFVVGGLAWIMLEASRRTVSPIAPRTMRYFRGAEGDIARFALVFAVWLPIRAVLMVAIYLHRAALTPADEPLHVANQFLSSWVLLAALVPPVVLARRWLRGGDNAEGPNQADAEKPKQTDAGRPRSRPELPARERRAASAPRRVPASHAPSPAVAYLAAAACCLFGAVLVAVGLQWEPAGARAGGRVMFVERHAPWSPTDRPYDTEHFGGGDGDDSYSYTYAVAYHWLSQYYQMSRLGENDAIDDRTLSGCDVLVIKMPGARYSQAEVEAVLKFVRGGGGLLLIGDHTNLFGSAAHMNDIARPLGFTFRDDVLYSTQPSPYDEPWSAPLAPAPAIQNVPAFDFAVSCSIDPGTSFGQPVIAAAGLWSMPADYHYGNFMPEPQHVPGIRFGSFIQAWATHAGRGRAIAWGDSTIFSSFCVGQPGKFAVLLNLVEWLNHRGRAGLWWLWTLLGAAAIGNGLWLVRFEGAPWLVLLAALACGWTAGTAAGAALMSHELPLPTPVPEQRQPLVVIDRTASRVPLASSFQNDDPQGGGFGLFEQWIPRLGYMTVRAEGKNAFQGDALVMLYPTRPLSANFHRQLIDYVGRGGRLLVVDSGLRGTPSTANEILQPFGLSFNRSQSWQGSLVFQDASPPLLVEHAWEVQGGERFASLGGQRTVCATAAYGKGLVVAVGCGTLFDDRHMGGNWAHDPTAEERSRYDALFAILRRLVQDETPRAASEASAAASPLKPRVPRGTAYRRHGAP